MAPGGRGFLTLLALGILLPGVILATLGFRALRQDRLLAERQSRDMLQHILDLAAREVDRELARWAQWNDPDSAKMTFDRGRVAGSAGLLWLPGPLREATLSPAVLQAEEVEVRFQDHARALWMYEAALNNQAPAARAAILLRIARCARKAGDLKKALRCWRAIAALPPSTATAPARLALVQARAAPAIELCRDLLAGRLPLARESYFYYSSQAKELAGQEATSPWKDQEGRAIALTEAAEAFVKSPRRIPASGVIAFWDDTHAVVIWEGTLQRRLSAAAQAGLAANIRLAAQHSTPSAMSVARPLSDAALPWRIEAGPKDATEFERSLRNRQALYLGSLLAVLAALLSGIWLTARAMRRGAKFSRLQSDFVAAVSHEFRTPLTGIRQLAELLDSGIVQADDRRRDYYRLILQESTRLTHLIENLLDFSRLEAGRKQYHMESFDASAWLEETAAAARNPRLRSTIPASLPALCGDRQALATVIANLIDNALKYSPPESLVRLLAGAADGALSISVIDQGPGIRPEEQSRIFERFYRGTGDLSKQVKGAGIGLSLVKRIVEDHGGSVRVVSRPGEGSTFTVRLAIRGEGV
jgi:signal transduction histidine kinase